MIVCSTRGRSVPGSDPEVQCGQNCSETRCMAGPPDEHQGHICVKCGGEFVIGLNGQGTIHIDYVFLQPGAWGRYGNGSVLKSGVDMLHQMGVTSIRVGGSFTDPAYYFCMFSPRSPLPPSRSMHPQRPLTPLCNPLAGTAPSLRLQGRTGAVHLGIGSRLGQSGGANLSLALVRLSLWTCVRRPASSPS